MEQYVLTAEALLKARTYVPIREKTAFVNEIAPKCFDRLQITAGDQEPMPPMYMENAALKARYLMTALVKLYLRDASVWGEPDDEWLMTEEAYDRFAGSHIFAQIQRFKSDAALRNQSFDLLDDFRELERMLTAQMRGMLAAQNDAVLRQQLLNREAMGQLPEVLKSLRELQEAEKRKKKGGG